MADKVIHHDCK